MLTQEEWVQSCLSKYRWEPLPANQKWEAAHFPLPECLGGEDTVLLWSADHVVQGLLQSVEHDHKCFTHKANKTDMFYLTVYHPEYLELFERLKSQFNSRIGKIGGRKIVELKLGVHSRSAEQMTADGRKGAITNMNNKAGLFGQSAEQRVANAKKGGKIGSKKTNAQRWQCLVTGHISAPGGLARYQKARNIDTSLRTRRADLEG
jgi:hypothetical protein